MRLLFIEEDVSVHRWLAAQAEPLEDLELLFACDDQQAFEILAAVRPDAVFADASSGALPGSARWRKLQHVLNARFIPLIIYTSSRRMLTCAQRLRRHSSGVLASPFTLSRAIGAVAQVKSNRRAREARLVASARAPQTSSDTAFFPLDL